MGCDLFLVAWCSWVERPHVEVKKENEEEGDEDEEEDEIQRKCGIVSFESILGRHSRRETTVGKDDSMGIIGNSDILENCHRTLVMEWFLIKMVVNRAMHSNLRICEVFFRK